MSTRATIFVAAMLSILLASVLHGQPVPTSETARTSQLTSTSFGAAPERDLRPEVISGAGDYLAKLAKQTDPTLTVPDVEVIFWRNTVTLSAINAYEKLVTDNLAKAGYTYAVTGTPGIGETTFTANSDQQGKMIGYWQTTSQGMYLIWGRLSSAAPAPPAAPPAPAAPVVAPPADPAPAGDKDAEIAKLKQQLAAMQIGNAPAAGPVVAATPDSPASAAPVSAQAADNTPMVPLEKSDLLVKDANGVLVVADKDGKGIDGIKLSQHDRAISSPSIAVGPDGAIHVAFVESHRTTYAYAVYYRGSSDGGKTWTEAKNLSEDMVNIDVGRCQLLVDSHNRVYVIWRAGLQETWMIGKDWQGERVNLWYRVLDAGKWSAPKPIGETCVQATIAHAAFSPFAGVDAAGNVQVIWNVMPDPWHPELLSNGLHSNGIDTGLVFQSTLDAASASKPREVFLPEITHGKNNYWGPSCDGLDSINGYFDGNGAAHFVALIRRAATEAGGHPTHYGLIEDGKQGQTIDLPPTSFHEWKDIPTLLVDAKGKRHMIAMFLGGEHPNIRDYPLGSEDEPTVIRAAVGLNGTIDGFQAYQGPGGRMAVVMQMYDNGDKYAGESYVSLSTGDGKWSVPVNVTNNAGRKTFHNTQTSSESNVGEITACMPGQCAVAFDKDGHLVMVLIKGEYQIMLATAFGVNTAGGDVTIPTLRFLKF